MFRVPVPEWRSTSPAGFMFSFLKKISVAPGNGIPAEISRFSGDFDRKEFSNSKFRNFSFLVGISLHFAWNSVAFHRKMMVIVGK